MGDREAGLEAARGSWRYKHIHVFLKLIHRPFRPTYHCLLSALQLCDGTGPLV